MTNNKQPVISKSNWFTGAASLFFLVLVGAAVASSDNGNQAETAAGSSKECTKEAWICAAEKHEISMRWGCEDAIKAGLKDPRSYQANDVRYWPSMDVDPALVMVKINYSAKNSFGGSVRGNAVCHADASGNILSSKYL